MRSETKLRLCIVCNFTSTDMVNCDSCHISFGFRKISAESDQVLSCPTAASQEPLEACKQGFKDDSSPPPTTFSKIILPQKVPFRDYL